MSVNIDGCEALILFFKAQYVIFLTSESSQMRCSNSLTASVPAAAESPVVGDDVILTAAERPFLPVRPALSRTNAQRRSLRCCLPAASQQPLSALTGYHWQHRDVCLSVRGGEKTRVQQTPLGKWQTARGALGS